MRFLDAAGRRYIVGGTKDQVGRIGGINPHSATIAVVVERPRSPTIGRAVKAPTGGREDKIGRRRVRHDRVYVRIYEGCGWPCKGWIAIAPRAKPPACSSVVRP